MADTYWLIAAHHLEPPTSSLRKARQAAQNALSFDPGLAAAHCSIGTVLMTLDRNPKEALREWKAALQIDPNYAAAWHARALFSVFFDSGKDPVAALHQASRLEPLSAAITCDFAFLYYWTRLYDEAIEASRRALDLHPSFSRTYVPLARAHAAQGRYEEAIAICHVGRPLFRGRAFFGQFLATLGYCYGRIGRIEKAAEVLEELREMGRQHYVSSFDLAVIHTGMGDVQNALESLRQAVAENAFWLISLPKEALLDPLRGENEFATLCDGIWAD